MDRNNIASITARIQNGAGVFMLALALRLFYCFALSPRQLCGLNDHDNLAAGWGLAQALKSPSFIHHLGIADPYNGPPVFGPATSLLDTLIRMGPAHPFYMQSIVRLFDIKQSLDPTSVSWLAAAIVNCVVGALSCVLIYYTARFAFNRRVAALAALLAIVYPAAIVNDMHCYPESLCFGLVSLFMCLLSSTMLRHGRTKWMLAASFSAGLAAALIGLCVPLLGAMPLIAFAFLAAYQCGARSSALNEEQSDSGSQAKTEEKQPNSAAEVRAPQATSAEQLETSSAPATAPSESGSTSAGERQQADSEATAEPSTARSEATAEQSTASSDSTTEQSAASSGSSLEQSTAGCETPVDTKSIAAHELEASANEISKALGSADSQEIFAANPTSTPSLVAGKDKPIDKISLKFWLSVLLFVAGFAVAFAPWVWLQQTCTGKFELLSVPTLSSQLWVGNLPQSGWRTLPNSDYLNLSLQHTIHLWINTLAALPIPYLCLLMQKITRLWAGAWNDYQCSVYLLSPLAVNVTHSLYLLCAFFGAAIASLRHRSWRQSRMLPCVVALAIIVVYHFCYCGLVPLSRNAFTAMPAIIVLAAFGIERLLAEFRANQLRTVGFFALSIVLLTWLQSAGSVVPLLLVIMQEEHAARVADLAIIVATWVGLALIMLRLARAESGSAVTSASDMIKFGCFCAILITIGGGWRDQRWKEWSSNIKSTNEVSIATISLPALTVLPDLSKKADSTKTAFVVFDAQSAMCAPPVSVQVNGVASLSPPIPWLELKPMQSETFSEIWTQASGMGTDWRTMRQWWAVPVPFSALKFGEKNIIKVTLASNQFPYTCRVFGQYGAAQKQADGAGSSGLIPSLHVVSWDKGFGTFEAGDMRPNDNLIMMGVPGDSYLEFSKAQEKNDLSMDFGTQSGTYRMHIAIPTALSYFLLGTDEVATPPKTDIWNATEIATKVEPISITGTEPNTYTVATATPKLESGMDSGVRYTLDCELCAIKLVGGTCAVQVQFSGTDSNDRQITWSSPWQTGILHIDQLWRPYHFAEDVPADILKLKSLTVRVSITPYDDAAFNWNAKRAKEQTMQVRNLSLKFTPPLEMPHEPDHNWLLF